MVDLDLSKLPFKEDLEDTDLAHLQDTTGDYRTTWARVWAWIAKKIKPTIVTKITSTVALYDGNDSPQKISKDDLQKDLLTEGLLNSLTSANHDALKAEGYTGLQIWLWELRRKSNFYVRGDEITVPLGQADINTLLASQPAKDYLKTSGFWFLDGTNGTMDMRGRFRRYLDLGANRDAGRQARTYQEDAMQRLTGDIGGNYGTGNRYGTGVFARGGVQNWGGNGNGGNEFLNFSFDNARQARTSSETRPKNGAEFSVMKLNDIDWRTIPAKPTKW